MTKGEVNQSEEAIDPKHQDLSLSFWKAQEYVHFLLQYTANLFVSQWLSELSSSQIMSSQG